MPRLLSWSRLRRFILGSTPAATTTGTLATNPVMGTIGTTGILVARRGIMTAGTGNR
jgi:hypothetical protein